MPFEIDPLTFGTWITVAFALILVSALVVLIVYKLLATFVVAAAIDDLQSDYKTVLDLKRYTMEQDFITQREEANLKS